MNRQTTIFITFLILSLGVSLNLDAQSSIHGTVIAYTGEAIIGANVYIEDSYDGVSTDTLGNFEFDSELTGIQNLIVSYLGYETFERDINLDLELEKIEVLLLEDISEMDPIVITAGVFEAGTGKGEVLKPLDIVTTAGATADIAGALNTLPGTTTVGEEGRLFVRGGDGSETLTFIDGLGVLDSYETTIPNVATRSRFSPMMFSGMSFSTGGYSAEYGRALSSALILSSKDVSLQDRSDISIMTVGLDLAHTESFKNSSISGKVQYTNLTPYMALVKQRIDWIKAPEALEGNLAYRYVKDGLTFKSYGKFNTSSMKLNYQPVGIDSSTETMLTNQYLYLNSFASYNLSDKTSARGGISYTRSITEASQSIGSQRDDLNGFHFKGAIYSDPVYFLSLNFGTEVFFNDLSRVSGNEEGKIKQGVDQTISATFMEGTWAIGRKLSLRTGVRTEYFINSDHWSFDPRASLAIKSGDNSQLGLSWGVFRQNADTESYFRNPLLSQQKAEHAILSYQVTIKKRVLRLEAFNKTYNDLIKIDSIGNLSNSGSGYARGMDLFWRDNKTFKNVDYWISYSYIDTKRNYRDYPYASTPGFVADHNLSIVYKHWFQSLRSQLGLTYTFASPRRYNDPNTVAFNNGRTPNYHDLSMNISYLMKPNVIFYLSITNLLGRKNIYGYEYSQQPDETGLYPGREIVPPADRFAFLGVFITLSKTNTMNQLPSL